ncbi:hypothetical protein SKAU_G00192740 [Synaphobranchus kaupii]|uniref:Uncharacterized protein n=1 Tax=Synaphobranchus kaupii TaxID=118154 RepID=A0A9Q1FE99_SYNKA|nr:hypothetical protein SKAU_G00192740 [Synaphobranchus kaupii]
MDSSNQAMWTAAGLTGGQAMEKSYVDHQFYTSAYLFFCPDTPHLIKVIKTALCNHNFILPPEVVQSHNLPTNIVLPAGKVFSKSMSAAIRFLVNCGRLPREAETTAWFVELTNDWFDLMTARNGLYALYTPGETNSAQWKLNRLQDMLTVWTTISLQSKRRGSLGGWKPSQTGVKMATSTMLVLAGSLLFPADIVHHLPGVLRSFQPANCSWVQTICPDSSSLRFFLTGRVSTDANENLHSQLRVNHNLNPQARDCRARLKLLSINQFEDSRPTEQNLITYLDTIKTTEEEEEQPVEILEAGGIKSAAALPLHESQVLYYITGWEVFKELKKSSCDDCHRYCLAATGVAVHNYATIHADHPSLLAALRNKGGLKYPSMEVHNIVMKMNRLMKGNLGVLSRSEDPIKAVMFYMQRGVEWMPACHGITQRILKKIAKLTLHMLLGQNNNKVEHTVQYGSKSAQRVTAIK